MSNKFSIKDIGFPGVLFIVLLVCKLFGANISWLWVFAPLWIPISLFILSLIVIMIYCLIKKEI